MCHDGSGSCSPRSSNGDRVKDDRADDGRAGGGRWWIPVAIALFAIVVLVAGGGATAQTGPSANLTYAPAAPDPGETVTFDATESAASEGEEIVECAFDVDDDGTFEGRTETCTYEHAYVDAAEYTAVVRVTSSSGDNASVSRTVSVQPNEAPTAAIDVTPAAPQVGESVTLSAANASDPDGTIVAYRWSVDGTEYRGETVTIDAGEAGMREVTLVVTDDDGAEAEATTTVDVSENDPPEAAITATPSAPTVGETVTLDASASADPDGTITAYQWDVDGDGTIERTTEAPETTVTVDTAGNRTVAVTVVDDREATANASTTLTVSAAQTATAAPDSATAAPTTATATTTPTPSAAPATGGGLPIIGGLEFGLVPWIPDWLVLIVLVIVGAAVGVRKRETVRSKASEYRQKVKTAEFRKSMAKKGVGFVAKSLVKKLLRAWADVIEFVTTKVGELFESIGRAIKRGGKWVANALRSIGG